MPKETIDQLAKRGEEAAKLLTEHFTRAAGSAELTWDNHRWVRYRSLMGLVEKMNDGIAVAFKNPIPPDRSYWELINRRLGEPPKSYQWANLRQQSFAREATEELLKLAEKWQGLRKLDDDATFDKDNVPKPRPELRVRPRV
jgi:hypothetical protein